MAIIVLVGQGYNYHIVTSPRCEWSIAINNISYNSTYVFYIHLDTINIMI